MLLSTKVHFNNSMPGFAQIDSLQMTEFPEIRINLMKKQVCFLVCQSPIFQETINSGPINKIQMTFCAI